MLSFGELVLPLDILHAASYSFSLLQEIPIAISTLLAPSLLSPYLPYQNLQASVLLCPAPNIPAILVAIPAESQKANTALYAPSPVCTLTGQRILHRVASLRFATPAQYR